MIASIVNHKGGVGKTTLAVNLATALGNRGKQILVIDNDPQSNATEILINDLNPTNTLYELLESTPNTKVNRSLNNFVYSTKSRNVSIIPNINATSGLEVPLAKSFPESQYNLRKQLNSYVRANFDITLIDCQPTLGLFVANALVMSDVVIVPLDAGSSFSIDNLSIVMETIKAVQVSSNPNLKFFRMLINRVDKRTTVCKLLSEEIRKRYGENQVFKTEIPINTAIQQAEYAKDTLYNWDRHSSSAKAYRSLAKELIKILHEVEDA